MASLLWRLLRDYGADFALSAVGWALGFALLGLVVSFLFYKVSSHRGWLDFGFSWDQWLKSAIALLWIVAGALAFGSAGGMVGLERSLVHMLKREKVIQTAAKGAGDVLAPTLLEVLVEQLGQNVAQKTKGIYRVSMKDVKSLEGKATELLKRAQQRLAGQGANGKPDLSTVGVFRQLIVDSAFGAAAKLGGSRKAKMVNEFIKDLGKRQRKDGTVGVEDFAVSLSDRFLEPFAEKVLRKSFFWSEVGTSAITLLVWLLTLLLARVVRIFTMNAPKTEQAVT